MGSISSEDQRPRAVTVSLQDLQSGDVSLETLEEAFGPDSLGIILVKDLPERFANMRSSLLSYASYLANLPKDELAKVEKPETRYNIGWSHGKEKLANGQFDTFKGSFYFQPVKSDDGALEKKAREYAPDLLDMVSENVWPDEDVLPGFRECCLEMCELIVEVAGLVARGVDRFGKEKVEGYKEGVLEEIVRGSVSTKARLLHYFPKEDEEARPDSAKAMEDDWCGTHTDLGALTGLTSNMFIDENLHPPTYPSPLPEMPSHPDPSAGLWIKDRAGRTTKVDIPRDCLAFQTGMALEKLTRGKFRAVPHFVKGGKSGGGGVARNTLAVFTQPNLWEVVDEEKGVDFAGLAREVFGGTY